MTGAKGKLFLSLLQDTCKSAPLYSTQGDFAVLATAKPVSYNLF